MRQQEVPIHGPIVKRPQYFPQALLDCTSNMIIQVAVVQWLSRQSYTLKVPSSILGSNSYSTIIYINLFEVKFYSLVLDHGFIGYWVTLVTIFQVLIVSTCHFIQLKREIFFFFPIEKEFHHFAFVPSIQFRFL